VRIRIALTTAVAVTLIPTLFFTLFSSSPAASARVRHTAATRTNGAARVQQAAAARAAAFATAATAAQQAKYIQTVAFLQNLAFFNAIAQQQAAQAAAHAAPTSGGSDATSTNTPHWACIRAHESGGNYAVGNGGAYQFELGTWRGLTGLPLPAQDYPPSVQDAAALKLFAERGWEPWTTRFVCGL
jgi:transglycosylase-like protein